MIQVDLIIGTKVIIHIIGIKGLDHIISTKDIDHTMRIEVEWFMNIRILKVEYITRFRVE